MAARTIVDAIKANPEFVLGVATGSTPIKVYAEIAKLVKAENVDVSKVKAFALDEYVGISKDHPESYYQVIKVNVTDQIGLRPENVNTPSPDIKTVATAGADYEAKIKAAGGVDLQILGIGRDGHVGFNEPGSSLASSTRIKTLTQETLEDNARFFDSIDDVPKHCITQGIGTILRAKHLLLLAFGESKAEAIAGALEGAVTSSLPGSAVQLHPHVTAIVDPAAGSKLKNLEYYKWVYENKPSWDAI